MSAGPTSIGALASSGPLLKKIYFPAFAPVIGGAGATHWKLPVEEVIRQIEAGEREFYVQRPIGDEVDLFVAVGPGKKKYLMTLADFDQPKTLLNLPSCFDS